VTKADVCEQLAQNRYLEVHRVGIEPVILVRHAIVVPPSHLLVAQNHVLILRAFVQIVKMLCNIFANVSHVFYSNFKLMLYFM